MIQNLNFPLCAPVLEQWGGWEGLRTALPRLGLDGIEGIWCGEDVLPDMPAGLLKGYHLTFFPDWLDFYRRDTAALVEKFGSLEAACSFYGGGPEVLLERYRADLARARALGAQYVVFHVSDISIEEGFTYRWLHTNAEVIDASAELINALLRDVPPEFDFLVENQWWPGFTFTDPEMTARLLDAIAYPRKGILLDTGHLMNCFLLLTSQAAGAEAITRMLERHGALAGQILGVHLHQSLSGGYVRACAGRLPPDLPKEYVRRYAMNYAHIQSIDRHEPWTDPAIGPVLRRIAPRYLTHELAGSTEAARRAALLQQMSALRRGGLLS